MCFSAKRPDPVAEVAFGPRAHRERDGHPEDIVHHPEDIHHNGDELHQENGQRQEETPGGGALHGGEVQDDVMPILQPETSVIVVPNVEQVEEQHDRILELRLIMAIEEIARDNERLSTMVHELQQAIEQQTTILNRLYQDRLGIDMNNNEGNGGEPVADYHEKTMITVDESAGEPIDLSKSDKL